MKTTRDKVLNVIRAMQSKAAITVSDRYYWAPSIDEVFDLMRRTWFEQYRYVIDTFDCDDFAVVCHAYVVQERYKHLHEKGLSPDEYYAWPFGQVTVSKPTYYHRLNIVYAREGLYFVEPQNDNISEVTPDEGNNIVSVLI